MSLRQLLVNQTIKNVLIRQIRLTSCWSCGKDVKNMISNLFCGNCKALQAPDKANNYFNIIGIKESYDLDENELANKYKDLQKYLHPDKFANR